MKPLTRVLIADVFDLVRRGVRQAVEDLDSFRVVGEAATGREVLKLAAESQPSIIVLDYFMPELNGSLLIQQLRKACPRTEILVYTDCNRETVIFDSFRAGARGLILKTDAMPQLLAALDALANRRPYFSDKVSGLLLDEFLRTKPSESGACLTMREREVIQLIAEGRLNKQIAYQLQIGIKTVETHRASVMSKLQIKSTAQLVRYAIRNNIVQA